MDTFITGALGELGPLLGLLFREIFRGGPIITLPVKEEHLWKMIRLIFAKEKTTSTVTNSALLDAFHELLFVRT